MTMTLPPAGGDRPSPDQLVAAHERRLAAMDRLLRASHPAPAIRPDDLVLRTDGGLGVVRTHRPDPASFLAAWGAAEQHQLTVRIGGVDPPAAMDALLVQCRQALRSRVAGEDPETELTLTWPSRDAAVTPVLLQHNLRLSHVIAARPARRPVPAATVSPEVETRPIEPGDLDQAARLWLSAVTWDAQFGAAVLRGSTASAIESRLTELVVRGRGWTWVARHRSQVVGLLVISPPERSGWIAPLTAPAPVAYLDCLVVDQQYRGAGVGAELVRHGHAALDGVGVAVTLLHYAATNPLSAPFWHRCGYRPLWSGWQARPASRLT